MFKWQSIAAHFRHFSRLPTVLKVSFLAAATVGCLGVFLIADMFAQSKSGQSEKTERGGMTGKELISATDEMQKATFGSGCFWCTEAVFQELDGVYSVVSGYSGGFLKNPTYKQVSTGTTGHAEVVQITYNSRVISFEELLEVFWKTHDPTTLNRQGADIGTQYRSVIFYHTDEQRDLATHFKKKLDESRAFRAPIVTEIAPFDEFYPGEDYHQNYFDLNGRQPYCQVVIRPKMDKFKRVFRDKLKGTSKIGRKVVKSDAQWKAQLTPQQYQVTRLKETEEAFSGEYVDHKEKGVYQCSCCGLDLYDSAAKYNAKSGWPSFWAPVNEKHILTALDRRESQSRTELKCARCGAHLGYLFNDGPPPSGLRHSLNSAALKFEKVED